MAVLLSLLFLCSVSAKFVAPLLTLTPDSRWAYLSKFILLDGRGIWDIRAKIHRPVNESNTERQFLNINVYTEENWEEALLLTDCKAKTAVSREKRVKVPMDGNFSTPIKGTLNQEKKVHVWYFAVSDCESHLPPTVKLRVELTLRTRLSSEFSYEDDGLVWLYSLATPLYLFSTVSTIRSLRTRFKRTEYVDWRDVSLCVALGLQTCGLFLQSLHLLIYSYNGSGVILFDFFSQALEAFSHLLVVFVLILISTGWTLKYREFQLTDWYAPAILLLGILHLALVCAAKITDDAYYKFSDYENTPGWILVVLRFCMWLWFLFNVKNLFSSVSGQIRDFLLSFSLFSSLYFLSTPCAVLLSQLFPVQTRNTFLAIGNLIIQTIAFWLLMELFSDKSTYFKVSTASEGVLPGKIRSD